MEYCFYENIFAGRGCSLIGLRSLLVGDLEAAAVEEYRLLGKPIEGSEVIRRSDGTLLFPSAARESPV